MVLKQLPDCKKFHSLLTLEKDYVILKRIGNCVVIELDDKSDLIIILETRFEG